MVESAPSVALASASSRTRVGGRPTTSASAERTMTERSNVDWISDIEALLGERT